MSSVMSAIRTDSNLREKARTLYEKDKLSFVKIAQIAGCSTPIISQIAREDGWKRNCHRAAGLQIAKNLKDQDKTEIIKLYKEGHSLDSIASAYGFKSRRTVREIVRSAGIDVKWKIEFNASQQDRIKFSFEQGFSPADIAASFGCDRSVIVHFLKQNGIKIRNHTTANYIRHKLKFGKRKDSDLIRLTRILTRDMYIGYKHVINPLDLPTGRGGDLYSVDHMYSRWRAFTNPASLKNPVNLYELCHPANLRMLTNRANSAKNYKSEFSARILRKRIDEWNLTYGDPYYCRESDAIQEVFDEFGRYENYGCTIREARGRYYQTRHCP